MRIIDKTDGHQARLAAGRWAAALQVSLRRHDYAPDHAIKVS